MARPRALLLLAILLVAAVFLVYAPIGGHEWIAYDDPEYLTENPHVARGLAWNEVRWAFTHSYQANYHPLTWIAHMFDVELWGLVPGPHHRTSVALHALNAVLVLLLLAQLTERAWAAGIGAALFALHPLRVESVAWAAERKDVLCGAFFLAALLLHLRHVRAPSRGGFLLVVVAFVLALLAKPSAVAFPAVVLLLDLWLRPAAVRRGLRYDGLVYFALAAAAGAVTVWAQSRDGSASSLGVLALDLRVLNALRSLGVYVLQTIAPRGLAVFYPHAAMVADDPERALAWPALAGAALVAAGALLAWRTRRAAPALGVGLGAFLVLLLPVLGLVQVGTQAHADRYTYLPSIGLALALAGGLAVYGARHVRLLVSLGAGLALLLGVRAQAQLGYWKDTRTLFERALALDEKNHVALLKLGELALAEGDLQRARASFTGALALHPGYIEAVIGLARSLRELGELAQAQALLERALPLDAGLDLRLNLAAVALERGDLATARAQLEHCLARAPADPDVLYNLGHLALREQRPAEAEERFLAVLALDAHHVDAWSNLGQLRLAAGRTEEAVAAFEQALRAAPDDPLAHFNLGIARRSRGDYAGARKCFERALALDPGLELARAALASGGGR